MINIINDFKAELITIAERRDSGKTALLIKVIKDSLTLQKKVLFFSLETRKDLMLKRMQIDDCQNLIVIDKVITSLDEMKNLTSTYNSDLIVIDYLQLLPNNNEAVKMLKQISIQKDIPIIIASELSRTNDKLNFNEIHLQGFIAHNPNMNLIIEQSDVFSILYHKRDKEYMLKQLKNNYAYTKEIDIREILN